MQKGLFITLEGPDGCGKTSVTNLICEQLTKEGYEIVHTREPGGVGIAEAIRDVILDPKNTAMDARTEALLYAASRRQHLAEKVIPSLEAGKIVICERFIDSSLAYQGYGREIGFDQVLAINEFAINGLFPDLTLYLDVDEEVGLARIKDRTFKDRLDVESLAFHHRVNEGYQKVLTSFKDRIKVIDASRELNKVVKDCYQIIKGYLND